MVSDRCRLFEATADEVGLSGDANQQGGDQWILVAHVSGPLMLQPELYVQSARVENTRNETSHSRGLPPLLSSSLLILYYFYVVTVVYFL